MSAKLLAYCIFLGLSLCLLLISNCSGSTRGRGRSFNSNLPLLEEENNEADDDKEDAFCSLRATICCVRREKRIWTVIEGLYDCFKAVLNNIMDGNIVFPKACCKVPIINLGCNVNGRRKRSLGWRI